jgi:hypothetical protein
VWPDPALAHRLETLKARAAIDLAPQHATDDKYARGEMNAVLDERRVAAITVSLSKIAMLKAGRMVQVRM